ncbi:uncharacterized protein F5891DRAFT_1202417 [Suillus fuscotomentosus]|uniref:Uncharacterized protein n=1 Tax=Suillus fuscotomentosus TaxID=1912939 RepID=A0AAD4DMX5_9AGAM|nr:uncharacterized protein F5891DRAFT_1202417 [Suillus fuscotomentosus]KAG1884824.1 hypothetical protein F5891DRAFT_1202417 [Suillus fuscotomentosus]
MQGGRGLSVAGGSHYVTVTCPACLQPGKNLPDNWQDTPKSKGWLYDLFLTIDANFCLKRWAVSSDKTDPSLSQGWAYVREETSYKSYISDRAGNVQEKSTCLNHNAMNMADTKLSQGLAAMGVELKGIAIIQASAHLSLAQLKAKELKHDVDLLLYPDVLSSVIIASGMDLEEEQLHLKVIIDNTGIHATDSQKLSVLRMWMSLHQKIDCWRQTQLLYILSVCLLVTSSATSGLNNTELTKLWLLSALNTNVCDPHLQHIEWELQFTQAHDTLESQWY